MSANVLTPLTLWRTFSLDKKPRTEVVSSKQVSGVVVQKLYIDGRNTKSGTVKIYCISARPKDIQDDIPTLIVFTGRSDTDEEKIAINAAKSGYYAFVVNLYGKKIGAERYTLYPDDISYANYEESADCLQSVKKDVKHTCWYEWSVAARYVYATVKSLNGVSEIGVAGVREFATSAWHLAATEDVSCLATVFGFGWETNRGVFKFSDEMEPNVSDESLMFVAGIEPESYAMHVKCPTLILTSTNSKDCDVDRAYDTVIKINDSVFRAVDYSVNFTDSLSSTEIENLKVFFDGCFKNKELSECPTKADITAEIKFGKLLFCLSCDENRVDKAELYVSEEIVAPYNRCWKRIEPLSAGIGRFTFEYLPYAQSGQVTFFCKIKYKNGLTFCSPVLLKKFLPNEITVSHKSNVIYSGRDENAESVFAPYNERTGLFVKPENEVVEKNGPMGIRGVYSTLGLQTFRINAKKYKPKDDAIFMFDVYSKEANTVTVKFIKDDGKTVYKASYDFNGGKIWYNVKFEKSKFKTEEGMILKTYDKVGKIVFEIKSGGLINNVLWV